MKNLLCLFSCALTFFTASAQVVINEVMQSNIDCIMDDLNDFPDSWVELYNSGTSAVSLSEYSIGTSDKASKAWQIPDYRLAPNSYVMVWCDKGDDDWNKYPTSLKAKQNWHTPFRLESGKDCKLYLFKNGEIVDKLPDGMKKQPTPNIAFGRKTDGSDEWGYQSVPTPGEANCGTIYKNVLGEPVFSTLGTVFSQSKRVSVQLSLPDDAPEGTEIRYTTDCTEPTKDSRLYTGKISFSGSRILKARLFCEGYLSPRSTTQSYIRLDHETSLPIISISIDNRYLTDREIGIYVEGTYSENKKNYEFNWRRPINFEYFESTDQTSVLNQLCEARITGGATRGNQMKSLGIYANKRFGVKRLSYEFFPDERPGVTDFKSIMLRNAGNDFDYLYMRDAIIQRLMSSNLDIDHQAWRPAVIIINGEYKGILNIRERSNEDNIYTNYRLPNGDGLEDIDMIENWWELKEGTWDNWNAFKEFYNEHGHTYEEYDQWLDVQEFMDVVIMNLYFCNLDFPGNNNVFWRPREDGGRWRIIVKDTDFGLGLYGRDVNYKIFQWINNPDYDSSNSWANGWEHTRLFRRLMEDDTFYREFIDRFAIYMGDFMNYERGWEIWEPMYDMIKDEYPIHRALINKWWPNYNEELSNAKNWFSARTDIMYNQINEYYKVGEPYTLQINQDKSAEDLSKVSVSINDWTLTRGNFNGKFFYGRDVTLYGDNVLGWKVTEGNEATKNISGDTYKFTMPSHPVTISAIIGSSEGIDDILIDTTEPYEIFTISGIPCKQLQKGLNIIRTKDGKTKSVWY